MNNPAARTREDVSTDLNVAGFDERKSRAIVQAVVDTTASLPLVTRTALARVVAPLNGKINTLIKKIAEVKEDLAAHKTETKEDIADLKAETKEDIADLKADFKAEIDRLYRLIFWGFAVGLSWLSVLLAVVGCLVKAG